MEDIEKILLKIQDNTNSQEINDILIELSKNPSEKSLVIVDYFLDSYPLIYLFFYLNILPRKIIKTI